MALPLLKDHFYRIEEQTKNENEGHHTCRLSLNASHPIYQAHFPGNPVTPAACIVQIVKEVASVCYEEPFVIREIKNVKFLHVLHPVANRDVSVHLSQTTDDHGRRLLLAASVRKDATIFSTLNLVLEKTGNERILQARMDRLRMCVVIPTYNNAATLEGVLREVLRHTSSVIVVNDGSTDGTAEILARFSGMIDVVSYAKNRGKGYALRCGFDRARATGYRSAITMDSDGQHNANELDVFVRQGGIYPNSLLVGQRTTRGHMPTKNSFANRFSSFWFALQTGRRLRDTQNGFRLYPLTAMNRMAPFTSRYEAELELLVRAAWKGIPLRPVPVNVYYAPENERVTHFRPGLDFLRISLLNALFVVLALIYGYPRMLCRKLCSSIKKKG
jgi:3-hydroxymyristoyl/3-hydroxydecanoyl-(acyl carrier protein) dehydratase